MNTGKAMRNGRMVQFGLTGQADLTGVVVVDGPAGPIGLRLEIEVKSERGLQRRAQMLYERMINRIGGIYILARSPQEAEELITSEIILRGLKLSKVEGARGEDFPPPEFDE